MSASELQKKIERFNYCDARVLHLNCDYFADEISLAFEDDGCEVTYSFLGCYKSIFDHVKNYDKLRPVREMTLAQIPYFIQSINVDEIIEDGVNFYTCSLNMFPLYMDIWCKDIAVSSKVL